MIDKNQINSENSRSFSAVTGKPAEASSPSVFQFPKFRPASASRTEVRAEPGILLDYEVEICVRFDRDLTNAEDFDQAVKGFFLCGDFTNRNQRIATSGCSR